MSHHTRPAQKAAWTVCLALSVTVAFGCDRAVDALKQKAIGAASDAVKDKVNEVVVEKVVQAGLENSGMKNVKADLSKNGINSLSATDKDGKTVSMASGSAIKFSESDFGVPFYPGAKIDDSKSVKFVVADTVQNVVVLDSADAFDKVSAFYRDKVKAVTGNRRFMESAESGKLTLMLMDEKQSTFLMALVEAPEAEPTKITLTFKGPSPSAAPAAK